MEDLLEVLAGDPAERLLPGQCYRSLPHHVDGHPERGPAGPLADPGLEHPELALLDGELGVAHVAVVVLEPGEDREQFLVDGREAVAEPRQRLGVPDPRHHVLALCVDQEVAVLADRTGRRVAGEADPGTGVVVAIAEDHRLDVDRGTEVVGDPLLHPVGHRPGTVPRGEDGLDRPPQLLVRILREGRTGVAFDDLLVGVDQVAQQLDGDPGVRRGPGQLLGRVEQRVEFLPGDVQHDPAVHRDEAPVRVVGEALVVGLLGQSDHGWHR